MANEMVRNRRVAEIRTAVYEIRKRNRQEEVSNAIGVPGHRRSSFAIAWPFWSHGGNRIEQDSNICKPRSPLPIFRAVGVRLEGEGDVSGARGICRNQVHHNSVSLMGFSRRSKSRESHLRFRDKRERWRNFND